MEQFDIINFNEGNIDVFNQVYKSFSRPLHHFAYNLTGNHAEAEDIVAEVMIKLWQKRSEFDNFSGIRSFLYVATRHASVDYLRAQQRHSISHREIFYLSEAGEEAMDEERIQAEILHELYQEIENLPHQCREVFKLVFFKRKTTEEVATLLCIKPQTVLNQKTRARQLLRTALLRKKALTLLLSFILHFSHLAGQGRF